MQVSERNMRKLFTKTPPLKNVLLICSQDFLSLSFLSHLSLRSSLSPKGHTEAIRLPVWILSIRGLCVFDFVLSMLEQYREPVTFICIYC